MMKFLKGEKGNVTIIVSLILVSLLGMTALVVDMGVLYAEKIQMANAIDAALLAGGQELPSDKVKAKEVMEEYLVANGIDLSQVVIDIEADGKGATIEAIKNVPMTFGRVLGITDADVQERGSVILGAASSAKGGIRPFGVEKFDFEYGDEVVLKEGAGDGYHGNFGGLALGGSGA